MKNLMFLIVLVFLVQLTISAQSAGTAFNQGSWELNFTGSLGSIESKTESSSIYFSGSHSESQTYFQLGIIPAYYVTEGLSIEPEISVLAIEKTEPSFLFLGNLAYTFKIESAHFFPFIRAGYGITNAFQFPVNGTLIQRISNSLDIGVLNLGAGMKMLLTESVLFRSEINYRKFSYSENSDYGNYSYDLSSIALVFGFSVLF